MKLYFQRIRASKVRDLFEVIIIDGVSTDGTLDVVQENSDLVDLLISEPDEGIYDAMNKGIEMASGQSIILVNSDDPILSEGFDLAVQDVINHEADIHAFTAVVTRKGREVYRREPIKLNFDVFTRALRSANVIGPYSLHKKGVLDAWSRALIKGALSYAK